MYSHNDRPVGVPHKVNLRLGSHNHCLTEFRRVLKLSCYESLTLKKISAHEDADGVEQVSKGVPCTSEYLDLLSLNSELECKWD